MLNAQVPKKETTITSVGSSPTITIVDAPTADTEVNHVVGNNTVKYIVKSTLISNLRVGFSATSTDDGNDHINVPKCAYYWEDNLNTSSLTIYLRTDVANNKIEILEWN